MPSSVWHPPVCTATDFSLVRKVFCMSKEAAEYTTMTTLGCTLGEALIAPTKIYVKALKCASKKQV